MLFNSWQFVLLVIVTALLNFRPTMQQAQRLILVISSLIFYGAHHLSLLGSITTNAAFTGTLSIEKHSTFWQAGS